MTQNVTDDLYEQKCVGIPVPDVNQETLSWSEFSTANTIPELQV